MTGFPTRRLFASLAIAALALAAAASAAPPHYDLVIEGGRVIDPESGLDAVRNVGVLNGKVAIITAAPIEGARVVHAEGLVVAPGFIDLHSHSQQLPGARMQAFDGVTTALELEMGSLPIEKYYADTAAEGRPINYGASVSWAQARMQVMDGVQPRGSVETFQEAQSLPNWSSKLATPDQLAAIRGLVDGGLKQGGLGVGFLIGYAPPSGRKEYYEINKLAAERGVPTFTHVRYMSVNEPLSGFEAYQEVVADAASTGAHMHICHINSTSLRDIPKVLELVSNAQKHGVPLTVEAYPYGAGSTVIGAAMFRGPDWKQRLGDVKTSDFEYNGQTLNDETFAALQKSNPGALIVFHYLRPDLFPEDQKMLDSAVLYPGGAIASDAMPWTENGKMLKGQVWPLPADAYAHPRSAGTFTRFLRLYVRERPLIGLPEAIRKMTLIPAQILQGSVPQMRNKGRLKAGADADIVVFDPAVVGDRATYDKPAQTSAGMRWVIVNGQPVIEDGQMNLKALPGRPVRRPAA
ncbi:MAG TPA: amidohydrolase family protein [Caulobacteraceae bacterium]|jgi:N-acyl-D-glutamate deacylase